MPFIRFVKNRPPIEVPAGANLMESLLAAGLPVASSCLGKGICSKCRIEIVQGREALSVEEPFEKQLRERNNVDDSHRISCQTTVHGDITIDTGYW